MSDDVRDDYAKIAKDYDVRWETFSKTVHNWVMAHMNAQEMRGIERILDLGCGTGAMIEKIAPYVPNAHITGIDASPDMIRIAQQKLRHKDNIRIINADVESAQNDKIATADIIFCLNALHHFDTPEAFLERLSQNAKGGCRFYLCTFAKKGILMRLASVLWRFQKPSFKHVYSPRMLQKILHKNFQIEESDILRPDGFWRLQIYRLRSK